jgi:hypothetical protein
MPSFDPETAYNADYAYRDRVKDVTWEHDSIVSTGLKARFSNIDTPDLVNVAASLGLSSDAAAVVLWEPKPTDVEVDDWEPAFAPKSGHILRREDTNEGWSIVSVTKSNLKGKWQMLVDKEVVNA